MKGTFRSGDLLSIQKVQIKDLSKGDIIVFNNIQKNLEENFIVHRIIHLVNENITTKGDNNKEPDILPVTKVNFIGRVENFERKGIQFRVRDGLDGLWLARSQYFFRRILILIYTTISRITILRNIMRYFLRIYYKSINEIRLLSPKGIITKWVYKQKVIARKGPEKNYFYCQKPFDLIIKK